jgi:hypothetical protein
MSTKGGLQPAVIFESDKDGNPKGGLSISFMFNPNEYSVTQSNTYKENTTGNAKPQMELSKAGHQQLTINKIMFDTYAEGKDVSLETDKLWQLMKPIPGEENPEGDKPTGRYVTFSWGTFYFVSVLTKVTQKFILFLPNGTPVRALVDITFSQYEDRDDRPAQNPTSGGGPAQRIHRIAPSDRLEGIAYKMYGDASKWPIIADFNNIDDPTHLPVGKELMIPEL